MIIKGVGVFVGIDPGVGGGIAAVNRAGAVVFTEKMPRDEDGIRELMPFSISHPREWQWVALIEKVHASPQMGTVSAFTFGRVFGALCMALSYSRMDWDYVQPRRWQNDLGCLTGGDKNVSKAMAVKLFPSVKITHAIADALLIAEFCRRQHMQE